MIKERVKNQINAESNPLQQTDTVGLAINFNKEENIKTKLTSDNYKIDCLKQIVTNEQARVNQRLNIVREKSKLLSQLIKDEEIDGTSTENSVIKRGIWNLLHN